MNMTLRRRTLIAALCAACFALPVWAQELTVGDSQFPITSTVDGQKLALNGAGIRYKAIFKVYAAGLYLPKGAKTTEQVLAMPGAKRVTMVFLRELNSKEFGKLMIKGVEDNVKDRDMMVKAMPGLMQLGDIFSRYKKLEAGDVVNFDLTAKKTVELHVRGKAEEVPGGLDFYKSIMLVWLGPNPVDWKLKDAMLTGGVTPTASK